MIRFRQHLSVFAHIAPWLFIAAASAHYLYVSAQSRIDAVRPVTEWMVVHDLIIPDFRVGEDAKVQFHRKVFKDLFGGWGVEVHDDDGVQACATTSGRAGGSVYSVSETSRVLIPFRSYTGGCKLAPGKYRASVIIRLSDGSGNVKPIAFKSNWFRVTE